MKLAAAVLGTALVCGLSGAGRGEAAGAGQDGEFRETFALENCTFASNGSNYYFVLEPGHRVQLAGEDGKAKIRVTMTVLQETKVVAGVETRVVEERESRDGILTEVSRNYFAVCAPSNDVYHFGETVEQFRGGRSTGKVGSWEAGLNGARPGLMMPAVPNVGMKFYHEVAPNVAMDRAEVLSVTERVKTAIGELENVMKVAETSPLEAGVTEFKFYAPGIGLVKDGKREVVDVRSGVR